MEQHIDQRMDNGDARPDGRGAEEFRPIGEDGVLLT